MTALIVALATRLVLGALMLRAFERFDAGLVLGALMLGAVKTVLALWAFRVGRTGP